MTKLTPLGGVVPNLLNHSFLDFIASFEAGQLKPDSMSNLKFRIADLFDSRRKLELARKALGREQFRRLPGLYFQSFMTNGRLDVQRLDKALSSNEKVLSRHLGKHAMILLQLIVAVSKAVEQPKRGLLDAA